MAESPWWSFLPQEDSGGEKISKTAVEEVIFLGTKLISEF